MSIPLLKIELWVATKAQKIFLIYCHATLLGIFDDLITRVVQRGKVQNSISLLV